MSSARRPPPSPPLHTSAATASTSSQSGRAGGRRWRAPTRVDLLTFLIAAMLCSASYWMGISHNSRGATDSRVLGPSVAAPGGNGKLSCVVRGARAADADEPLDFEAHHAADSAGLSVSAAKARTTTGARRALLGTGTAPARRALARRR